MTPEEISLNRDLKSIVYKNSEGILCTEKWASLPEYDIPYHISDLGRVKTLKRKENRNGVIYNMNERILKLTLIKESYYHVKLKTLGCISVHKLVAMAFLGHKRCGYTEVIDHLNDIKTDNRVVNLKRVTSRENTMRGHKNKTSKYTGVSWSKRDKKWLSMITIGTKQINLGAFSNEHEAHLLYEAAVKITPLYSGSNSDFRHKAKELCIT